MHAVRRRHVSCYLADRAPLVAGQLEGQRLLELGGELFLDLVLNALDGVFRQVSGPGNYELHVEQLVKCEPAAALFGLAGGCGTVHGKQGIAQRRQVQLLGNTRQHDIVHQRYEFLEMILDEPTDLSVGKPLRGRIDRQHQSLVGVLVIRVIRARENDLFARNHLASVVVLDRPGHQQKLTFFDRPIEECLTWPRALDEPGCVANDRPKNAQPTACGQNTGRYHPSDQRDFCAYVSSGDRCDRRRIEIAVGNMVEEVLDRVDPESCKRLSSVRAHAPEILNRCIQSERHQSPKRRSANRRGSKRSRSSTASPTPRNRTGVPISR